MCCMQLAASGLWRDDTWSPATACFGRLVYSSFLQPPRQVQLSFSLCVRSPGRGHPSDPYPLPRLSSGIDAPPIIPAFLFFVLPGPGGAPAVMARGEQAAVRRAPQPRSCRGEVQPVGARALRQPDGQRARFLPSPGPARLRSPHLIIWRFQFQGHHQL